MPIYCAVYLWASPIARISSPASGAELLAAEPIDLRGITGALTLAYIVPTILAALPSPSVVSLHRQQLFLAVWQLFPLLIGFCHPFLSAIIRDLNIVPESARQNPATKLKYARRVYRYILGITSVVHFSVIGTVASSWIWPTLFVLSNGGPINVKELSLLMSVFSPHPVRSMAEGNLSILQYDLYCATAGGLFWVTYMSYASSGPSLVAAVKTVLMALARSLVVGPGGAVLWAVWDRDEQALLAATTAVEEKKKQ
jgi:hypothetical protein